MSCIRQVLQTLERAIPTSWAETWDNPGLQVGDPGADVSRIGITLDVTGKTLEIAERDGYDLLISHHPLLFDPLRKLDLDTPTGKILSRAIRSGIGIVSLHTNWDTAPKGVNVCLADLLGLEETVPLQLPEAPGAWGMGAAGNLPSGTTLEEFTHRLRHCWKLNWVQTYGPTDLPVARIALCGGSGASLIGEALAQKADLFVTADVKYHQIEQALDRDLALCIVDHGEMEALSLDRMAETVTEATGLPATVLQERALPVPIFSVPPAERP